MDEKSIALGLLANPAHQIFAGFSWWLIANVETNTTVMRMSDSLFKVLGADGWLERDEEYREVWRLAPERRAELVEQNLDVLATVHLMQDVD